MSTVVNMEKKAAGLTPELQRIIASNEAELSLAHGNLLSATGGKDFNSLFITSCHPGEGKTVAAVSLAYSIAKNARLNILLVDGNLAAPALHTLLGTAIGKGLTDVIYDGVDVSECIHATGLENVSFLTCGSAKKKFSTKSPEGKAKSTTLYRSREFVSFMHQLRGQFDLVIFDGPSLLASSEASWACPHFDGVLLVIACKDTKWEIAQHVKEKLESVGGVLLGAVLNRRRYYVPSNLYSRY
jgi:protein-tyrosine kinase